MKRLVAEGDVVQVGQPIAEFSVDGETVTATAPAVEAPVAARNPLQPLSRLRPYWRP